MQGQVDTTVDTTKQLLTDFWRQIVSWLPEFIGALVILLIGYIIAKVLAAAVNKTLWKARLDQRLHTGKGGNLIQRAIPSPGNLLARLTFWVFFLGAVSIAVAVLGVPALVDFVRAVYGYIPNILAALLIFLVAGAVSAAVVSLTTNLMGDTPTGKIVATAAPIVVMGVAIFMILNQLRIAPDIVTITYAVLLGSAGLGSALAFGLGGREVAARILHDMYEKGRQNSPRVAHDLEKGAQEAQRRAKNLAEGV